MALRFDSLQGLLRSQERYLILIVLIMAMLVLGPILEGFAAIRIIIDVFLTAIVLGMLSMVGPKKRLAQIGLLLAIIMLALLWLKMNFLSKIC